MLVFILTFDNFDVSILSKVFKHISFFFVTFDIFDVLTLSKGFRHILFFMSLLIFLMDLFFEESSEIF